MKVKKMIKKVISIFAALVLSFGSILVVPVRAACAQSTPSLTISTAVADVESGQGWTKNLNTQGGRTVKFDLQIHNTVPGSQALNVYPRVGLPGGSSTSFYVASSVGADNASGAADNNTINIAYPGGSINYVPGSTRLTWDENGDGNLDFNQTPIADGIASGGIRIGDQSGCNNFVMRINFLATISGSSVPTTTTTYVPNQPQVITTYVPSQPQVVVQQVPGPTQTVYQQVPGPTQTVVQQVPVQGQTVVQQVPVPGPTQTIVQQIPAPGQVKIMQASAPVATKTPETGLDLVSLAGMFGAGPVGIALSRYGHGLRAFGKREEDWMGIAKDAFLSRKIKKI